jgi:hypothetical protein
MNDKEISIELSHSLSEWGVPKDEAHLEFRRGVILVGIGCFRARGNDSSSIKDLSSPSSRRRLCNINIVLTDITAAYEFYLQHEDIVAPMFCYEDMINMDASEPYYRWYNISTRKIEYKLKPKFRGISSKYLDPFDRFRYEEMSNEEHFFNKWLVDTGNAAKIGGKLMEVSLACHIHRYEACFHCNSKKSIRWNGGSNSSWQDLVCLACNATYEVNTKSNMEAVESAFRLNKIIGGSFEEFCTIRNSQLQPKMFCVLLPRKSIAKDPHNQVYPVYVAEITKGVPQLYHAAFNKRLPKLRFKTRISVSLNTKKKWFDLPMPSTSVDVGGIGRKVFIDRFSIGKYREMKNIYFGDHNDSSSDDESSTCNSNSEIIDAVAEITKGVRDIKTSHKVCTTKKG